MTVVEVDPQSDARWESFVAAHPDGLIYHRAQWLRVIERTYRHKPLSLACIGSDGQICGVLPLFHTRGFLTRHRFSSLPYTPVAGPLTTDQRAAAALLRYATELVHRNPGSWLQLKVPAGWNGEPDRLIRLAGELTYILDLPKHPEHVRFGNSRNHARIMWSIRKTSKEGLQVRQADTKAELRAWYELYLHTMRWHCVPPRPYRLFELAWDLLRPAGCMRLMVAERHTQTRRELSAGSIFLMSGRTVFYAFNGCRRDSLGQRPNDAIQWQAIQDASSEGYSYYDMGEVDPDNHGLADFKTKWGAKPTRLYRYYYPAPVGIEKRMLRSTHAENRFLRAAWSKVPLRVTALLADQLYRRA